MRSRPLRTRMPSSSTRHMLVLWRRRAERTELLSRGVERFEPFYLTLLERDFKLPPRPVYPEDYTTTKRVDPYDKGLRTTPEKEVDFFNELPKFKENKSKISHWSHHCVYRGANREESVVLLIEAVLR